MSRRVRAVLLVVPALFAVFVAAKALAEGPAASPVPAQDKGKMMLTIFLKHDQSMTLEEIQKHLEKTGFSQRFRLPTSRLSPGT